VARLPELERVALELVELAGLAPREAAGALEISPAALRVRLFRARTRLRKEEEAT
jgi:RNA polymerase sigma-70 factor (ECF subfamily)